VPTHLFDECAQPARIRVLIADDHRALLDRVVSMLSTEFSVIGAVADGVELVEAEAVLQPDVLVVDISMPRMSGLEAAEHIRRRGSQAAIVCLTAHDQREVLEAALAAGALGYVVKTHLARDLVPAIRAALEGRRFVPDCLMPPALPTG
jgi:DNA-binding NarL/FixJ family response regulator